MVMASFGASLALRSLLEFLFTSKPAYFSQALQIAMKLGLGLRATPDQLAMLAVALVSVIAVHLVMTRTDIGRAMRAVSENPGLPVSPASMFAGSSERPGSWAPHLPASPAS